MFIILALTSHESVKYKLIHKDILGMFYSSFNESGLVYEAILKTDSIDDAKAYIELLERL